MFIAKSIREKSVVEYLLYMWQMEDLIRAYGCSLTRIRREYIDRFDYTDQQKDEEEDWFGDLIRMMNQEGKRESLSRQIPLTQSKLSRHSSACSLTIISRTGQKAWNGRSTKWSEILNEGTLIPRRHVRDVSSPS